MIQVERYEPGVRAAWDDFIARSRNGVFLFYRAYMDYHADRFTDHSLLFRRGGKLVAVLPANEKEGTLVSHGGLTFGGIVTDRHMGAALMLEVFDALKTYAAGQGLGRLLYKPVPHIYHRLPAEEDLYALFRHKARLVRRDISSTVALADRPPLTKGRKWSIKKARTRGLVVRESTDFRTFMAIEEEHLRQKYGVRPTHTAAEMELLAGRLPESIKLFAAYRGEAMLGGTIVYEHPQVAHTQYIAATAEGKELGALDCVFDLLLNETYAHLTYFDFGISTEDTGRYLNLGLIENKESYGGRGTMYDFYDLDLAAAAPLAA